MQHYTCALFDVDGTIIDTETCHAIANQEVINRYGNGKEYTWDIRRQVMGNPAKFSNKILIDNYDISLTPEEMIPVKKEIIEKLLVNVKLLPGIKQIMFYLKEKGFKIAAATATQHELFEKKMKNFPEIRNLFDVVVCGDNPNVPRGKPFPDVFIYAAQLLGETDMSKTIIFEDSPNGALAGYTSGGLTFISTSPELKDEPAFKNIKYVFNSWTEFQPNLIGRTDVINYE